MIATVLPLPLVLFSPYLSVTSKVMSFFLPTLAHLLVGYWLVRGQESLSLELSLLPKSVY